MKLRLIQKATLEQISEDVDMSVSGVKDVIYKYLKNIDKKIINYKKVIDFKQNQ